MTVSNKTINVLVLLVFIISILSLYSSLSPVEVKSPDEQKDTAKVTFTIKKAPRPPQTTTSTGKITFNILKRGNE